MPALTFEVRAGALRDALGHVLVALPTENRSAHHRLDAVLFDLGSARLTLAAADGHRVAQAVLDVPCAGARRRLLPGRAMVGLARVLDRAAAADRVRVTLPHDGRELSFATPLATVACRSLQGTFPDLGAIMPTAWGTRLELDGPDLRRTVAALQEIAPDAPLVLEVARDSLALRLELPEDTVVRSALAATVEGDAASLRVHARLLRSLLDVSAAARVELGWTAPVSPLVIREVGGRGDWGVMPLRAPAEARTAA
jgi:DNA polymerase III sliding clamp (beta) subunit (PCNA family)